MDMKQWFKEAQYGMMAHWGLYSMLAGEWRGKFCGSYAEWIQANLAIPNADYGMLAKAFNPVYFDADEWAKIAVDAGMKYITVTSKHHDGFAMYHSKVDKFNVVDATPFRRDVIGEIANACAKNGLKLGLYYSQSLDWHEKHGGGYEEKYGKNITMSWCNDWDFPNAEEKNYSICFENKIKPQVKEILTQYGDLITIWFDIGFSVSEAQNIELYNYVKKYQPNCLINSRIGDFPGVKCDYKSYADNEIPDSYQNNEMLFETPATINDTWGYKAFDQNFKSAEEIYRIKKHLNERNVNYLLNVGPDGLGRIPAKSIEVLREVGKMSK